MDQPEITRKNRQDPRLHFIVFEAYRKWTQDGSGLDEAQAVAKYRQAKLVAPTAYVKGMNEAQWAAATVLLLEKTYG